MGTLIYAAYVALMLYFTQYRWEPLWKILQKLGIEEALTLTR